MNIKGGERVEKPVHGTVTISIVVVVSLSFSFSFSFSLFLYTFLYLSLSPLLSLFLCFPANQPFSLILASL